VARFIRLTPVSCCFDRALQSKGERGGGAVSDAIHSVRPSERLPGVAKGNRIAEKTAANCSSAKPRGAAVGWRHPSEADAFIAELREPTVWPFGPDVHPAGRQAPAPHFAVTAKIAARND